MAQELTIDELIDQIVEQGDIVGPDAITAYLLGLHDDFMHGVANPVWDPEEDLPRLVRVYVSVSLARRRSRPVKPIPAPDPGVVSGRPLSAKVQAIRHAAPQWLEEQVSVGRGNWKKVGDCTVADLTYMAQKRLQLSNENRVKAQVYLAWSERMRAAQVAKLRDLPNSQLNEVDPR